MISNSIINNWHSLTDPAIVREIGLSLRSMRLNKNLTQQAVSDRSGIDRVTISKVENGSSATLLTVVQLLRALDELEVLNSFQDQLRQSPLQVAHLRGKERKRASGKNKDNPK